MDEPTQQKLFDPFSPPSSPAGLGMSAILGIVRAHEGDLCRQLRRTGILDPRAFPGQADAMPPTLSRRPAAPRPHRPNCPPWAHLIVDDEDIVRRVCKHMLTKQGWRVIEAAMGCWLGSVPTATGRDRLRHSRPVHAEHGRHRGVPGHAARPADVRILLTSGYSSDQSTSAQLAGEGSPGSSEALHRQTLLHELERASARVTARGAVWQATGAPVQPRSGIEAEAEIPASVGEADVLHHAPTSLRSAGSRRA